MPTKRLVPMTDDEWHRSLANRQLDVANLYERARQLIDIGLPGSAQVWQRLAANRWRQLWELQR